ncbi:MAG: hypothetical protein MUC38_06360 [Cyclobacteriaceae bacterium]|nr:hypothetical protein [Cyclobacteriaceae bacterium]
MYWVTGSVVLVYYFLSLIFVDDSPQDESFSDYVPAIVVAVCAFCLFLNTTRFWRPGRVIFLAGWIFLTNISPPIFIGVSAVSFIIHPLFCLASSMMVHLLFSFQSDRWWFVGALSVCFVLIFTSPQFLLFFDTKKTYATLPFAQDNMIVIFITTSIFANLILIYFYRILWAANLEVQNKNEEIRNLNKGLEDIVQERTQQLRERNQRLQAYAYTNAHILRAPLSRILGLLNLMYKSEDPEEAKRIKQHLEESARELDQVIRQSSVELERNTGESER